MNHEEFEKKREETKKKFIEAIDEERSIGSAYRDLQIALQMADIARNHDVKISYEQKQGANMPIIQILGSRLEVAFAVCNMLNFDEDFYTMLNLIYHVKENLDLGLLKIGQEFKFDCENQEQSDVLKELYSKSPEEIEKLKKEMEK